MSEEQASALSTMATSAREVATASWNQVRSILPRFSFARETVEVVRLKNSTGMQLMHTPYFPAMVAGVAVVGVTGVALAVIDEPVVLVQRPDPHFLRDPIPAPMSAASIAAVEASRAHTALAAASKPASAEALLKSAAAAVPTASAPSGTPATAVAAPAAVAPKPAAAAVAAEAASKTAVAAVSTASAPSGTPVKAVAAPAAVAPKPAAAAAPAEVLLKSAAAAVPTASAPSGTPVKAVAAPAAVAPKPAAAAVAAEAASKTAAATAATKPTPKATPAEEQIIYKVNPADLLSAIGDSDAMRRARAIVREELRTVVAGANANTKFSTQSVLGILNLAMKENMTPPSNSLHAIEAGQTIRLNREKIRVIVSKLDEADKLDAQGRITRVPEGAKTLEEVLAPVTPAGAKPVKAVPAK
jgi:hypothetical protein